MDFFWILQFRFCFAIVQSIFPFYWSNHVFASLADDPPWIDRVIRVSKLSLRCCCCWLWQFLSDALVQPSFMPWPRKVHRRARGYCLRSRSCACTVLPLMKGPLVRFPVMLNLICCLTLVVISAGSKKKQLGSTCRRGVTRVIRSIPVQVAVIDEWGFQNNGGSRKVYSILALWNTSNKRSLLRGAWVDIFQKS